MALRVAVANHKGGVAKSTTTLMLAEGLSALMGLRVLVVDMDPQSSLSTMLLSRDGADAAAANGRSLARLLRLLAERQPVNISKLMSTKASDLIELRDTPDQRRVDLVASCRNLLSDLAELEADLREVFSQRLDVALALALAPELDRIDKSYDVVIFDCPAGVGPLPMAAIRMSRLVVAPTVLDSVSLGALTDFVRIIIEQDLDMAGVKLKVLPTLFQSGDPEQRRILDHIRDGSARLDAFPRPIPATVYVRRAVERIRPDSYRTMREKYAGALPEVDALARSVAGIVASMRGT